MHVKTILAGLALIAGTPVVLAGQANQAHTHIGHVASSFGAAPESQGLLPLAMAEARIAARHAELAAQDLTNLGGMKTHSAHVLHALSPEEGSQGPGQGFGVKRAAEAVATHIGMAASAPGASQNVATHAPHITASARTAAQRTDEAVALVARIQAARTYADAEPLVEQLKSLTGQIIAGRDANGDGRITWEEGEGGLEQAEQHLGLLTRAEGL